MRKILTTEIQRAFSEVSPESSYKAGFFAYITESQHELPLVWASPIELTSRTGRKEGKKTYSAKIYMLDQNNSFSQGEKEDIWERQEDTATKACEMLFESDKVEVVQISISCSPDEMPISGYDTISTTVTLEIIVSYCRQ
ncbi:MAG: hypothetical protein SNG69_07190 [Rikenellaceae bacterium]